MVIPRGANSQPFFVIKFTSVVKANYVCFAKWERFAEAGLYTGDDLTKLEQDNFKKIRAIMCAYWGV